MQRSSALISLAVILWPVVAAAQSWTGSVRDIRTDAPLPGSRACAGILGRVDLACVTSKSDGTFSVAYPTGSKPGSDNLYYLYIEPPPGTPYFAQVRARKAAGEAKCQLVPTTAYVRGRVVRADNGAPIKDVSVALFQPGRIDQSLVSDAEGKFSFKAVAAFENRPAQFNTYGVPKEDLPPKNDGELVNATWGVQAPYGQGSNLYALVEPKKAANDRLVPELVIVSSASPEAYTWVELRLPPVGTKVEDPSKYISSQLGPPSAKPDAGSSGSPDAGGPASPDAGAAATVDASSPPAGNGGSGGCSVPGAPSLPSSEPAFFAALCLSLLALVRARRRACRGAVDVGAPRE